MNIGNILNRRLGLITVPNLQKVVTNLLTTIGFVDDALPDSRPYKVYTALLTQTGTDAPVATVLENTLSGAIVWSYIYPGRYSGTLTGEFISNKTVIFIGQNNEETVGFIKNLNSFSINNISIWTFALDTGNLSTVDSVLLDTPIEIRVYN
jgi:hypothetical protein